MGTIIWLLQQTKNTALFSVHYRDQFFRPLREEAVLETDTEADLDVANEGGREDTAEEVMVTADVAEEAASEDGNQSEFSI